MKRLLLLSAASFLPVSPALPQSMDHSMPGMQMPGMTMPRKQTPALEKKRPKTKVAPRKAGSAKARPRAAPSAGAVQSKKMGSTASGREAHAGHEMPATPGMTMSGETQAPAAEQSMSPTPGMKPQGQHQGHDMSMPEMSQPSGGAQGGTDLPAGNAPAPPLPNDYAADRVYPQAEMAEARKEFRQEQGGQRFRQIIFNVAEYQAHQGKNGYRWDSEAWFGGDINRLWLKSEGEGSFRQGVEAAEIQALYSHAIGPYFNLQGGVRYDFKPNPSRGYFALGVEGLAPRMFEIDAAAFLSTKGDLLGRLDGYYDQRITQRLILQPRVELNFAAQDVPANRIGAGLVDAELGLRLRYEIRREFAPYIGISYRAKTGRTADFARAAGEDPTTTSLVAGVRIWF